MKPRWSVCTFLFAACFAVATAAAGETGEVKALFRVVSWLSEEATHRGVHVIEVADDGLSNQLFFRSMEGGRLVLSDHLDPSRGLAVWTLLDDRTGWRARLTIDHGYRAGTLNAFFAHGHEASGTSLGYRFETSTGLLVEGTFEGQAVHDGSGALLHRLTDEDFAGPLADSMPSAVRDAVLFFETSLAGVGSATRVGEVIEGRSREPLVELLSLTLRQEQRALRPPPVPMVLDELHKGLVVPQAVSELLTGFESVDRARPLRLPLRSTAHRDRP